MASPHDCCGVGQLRQPKRLDLRDAGMNRQLAENGHHSVRAAHSVDIAQESASGSSLEKMTPNSFQCRVLTK